MCASVHNHRQVRNVPQDVSRTMQHLQLFQEDCPYERDLRVSVLTWCWVHVFRVTCYLNSWPRMCLVHSRSCVKMLAMCKACPTLPPCSSCTPSPSCAHAPTRTRTGYDGTQVTRHTSHVTRHAATPTRHLTPSSPSQTSSCDLSSRTISSAGRCVPCNLRRSPLSPAHQLMFVCLQQEHLSQRHHAFKQLFSSTILHRFLTALFRHCFSPVRCRESPGFEQQVPNQSNQHHRHHQQQQQ